MALGREVFVVDALRTPIGRFGGGLRGVRADDLAAMVIDALLQRNGIVEGGTFAPLGVDEVIFGCANQAGEDNRNVARMATLLAGLPDSVPAITVNRLCASGMDAVLAGWRRIALGEADVVVCGGVESMTRAPWVMAKPEDDPARGNQTLYDSSLGWRFPNPKMEARFPLESMGQTAENVAARYQIGRADQDAFALRSHERAAAAWASDRFAREVIAVATTRGKETIVCDRDQGPRADTSLERLAKLRPAFASGGSVTAGNASTLNDGAAALLLVSAAGLAAIGRPALGKIVGGASAGVDPRVMGIGPVPAVERLFRQIGWTWNDVDLAELNEAFAAQALAVLQHWKLPAERVNLDGGAIALGHPLGMSGARITGAALYALAHHGGNRAIASLCVGVGQGVAIAVETVG